MLDDAWAFATWLDEVPDAGRRQLKLMVPHLLFPETFERFSSAGQVRQVLETLGNLPRTTVRRMTKIEQDRELARVRQELEESRGELIDFYQPDVKEVWDPVEEIDDAPTPASVGIHDVAGAGETSSGIPLNQVLYGPPGTGKTFQVVDRAVAILDPEFFVRSEGDREGLKERFDELVDEGSIRFVTFHQSFSYEEFIEGLRAETTEEGSVRYVVRDGILKSFCASQIRPFKLGEQFSSGYVVSLYFSESLSQSRQPAESARNADTVAKRPIFFVVTASADSMVIGSNTEARDVTYSQPFTVARMFASLDHLSGGRAGWNLVASSTDSEARNHNLAMQIPHSERYVRAKEFAKVVMGLWDCWADDALVCDPESGAYFLPERIRNLDFDGDYYKVSGPINLARSPQGRPIVVQAGSSDPGQELAAETADLVFTTQPDIDSARHFYNSLKDRMPRYGRDPSSLRILPGVFPIVASSEAEARKLHDELDALLHPAIGLAQMRDILGHDLSSYNLDGPLPEIPSTQGSRSRREVYIEMARRENLTIRQLFTRTAATSGYVRLFGPPEMIADELERWFTSGAADGFNVMPSLLSRDLETFVDQVVPILQKRGLMHEAYRGNTLREHIGLPRPPSVFG